MSPAIPPQKGGRVSRSAVRYLGKRFLPFRQDAKGYLPEHGIVEPSHSNRISGQNRVTCIAFPMSGGTVEEQHKLLILKRCQSAEDVKSRDRDLRSAQTRA